VVRQARGHNFVYGGTSYRAVRDLFRRLRLSPDDVFYDLGCGYGRVLLYGASVAAGRFRGVELIAERAAHVNAAAARLGLANVDARHGDVLTTPLDDGTVFFMFHPFFQPVMPDVVATLRGVAAKKPIRIASILYGENPFSREDWLVELDPPRRVVQAGAFTRIYQSSMSLAGGRHDGRVGS
jgi:SAM-dependent methyltransferase